MMTATLDCTLCGACCFGGHPKYIQILQEDLHRPIPAEAQQEIEGRSYMRMCGGHCAQLTPTPDARLVCAIYADRPEACRAFRAGSFECLKARQHRLHLAEALRLPVTIAAGPEVTTEPAMVAVVPNTGQPTAFPVAPAEQEPQPRTGQFWD